MKKYILIILLAISHVSISQQFVLGPCAGINLSNFGISNTDSMPNADSKIGYNFGIFSRVKIGGIFIQPEIIYIFNRTSIDLYKSPNTVSDGFGLGILTGSLMVGYKIGTLRIQAGPYAFKQINEAIQKNEGAFDLTLNKDNFNWGLQAGLGLNIAKRWQLDVRYMRSMQKLNYKAILNNGNEFFNGNMNTLYLSFGYSLIKI
jgi:hypothetical protein